MHIKHVSVENVQAIKAVSVTPHRNFVIVSGLNGTGKSSLLRAVMFALAGRRSHSKTPIRTGEDEGLVSVDLGDLVVDLELETGSAPKLTVSRRDTGERLGRPQRTIDEFLGDLTFDPLAFSAMDAKTQREVLLGVVDLGGFDLEANAAEYDKLFEKRSATNRHKRDIEGDIEENFPPGDSFDDLPAERIDMTQAVAELQEANELVVQNAATRRDDEAAAENHRSASLSYDVCLNALTEARAAVELCESDVARTYHTLEEFGRTRVNASDLVEAIEEPDIAAYEKLVTDAEGINERIGIRNRRSMAVSSLAIAVMQADSETKGLEAIEQFKKAALQAAKWPIDGLGVRKDHVTFEGREFGQACASERLRTSVAIGMALNPKLRVMFIQDASLLDEERMELLRKAAVDNDFQLWVERVEDHPQPGAIHIVDGSVVSEDGAVGITGEKEPEAEVMST